MNVDVRQLWVRAADVLLNFGAAPCGPDRGQLEDTGACGHYQANQRPRRCQRRDHNPCFAGFMTTSAACNEALPLSLNLRL